MKQRQFLLVAVLLGASRIWAAEFIVDTDSADPGLSACLAHVDEDCSLPGAIVRANADDESDVIQLGSLVYCPNLKDDAPASGFVVSQDLIVRGMGVEETLISCLLNAAMFTVQGEALLIVEALTISGARVAIEVVPGSRLELRSAALVANDGCGGVGVSGGGITTSDAEVMVVDSLITRNKCSVTSPGGIGGGGIQAFDSNVTVLRSEISENEVETGGQLGAFGAGLYINGGSLTLEESLVKGNIIDSAQGAWGSGIFAIDSQIVVRDTTIEDNMGASLDSAGGGVFLEGQTVASITSSTLARNESVIGGALAIASSRQDVFEPGSLGRVSNAPTAMLLNSTISGNFGDQGAGLGLFGGSIEITHTTIADQQGDGIGLRAESGAASILSSLLLNECELSTQASTMSLGGNVAVSLVSCFGTANAAQDLQPTSFGLSSLGEFGGATQTHLPFSSSPVLGRAISDSCEFVDQRSQPRSLVCDSGSVERQPGEDLLFVDRFGRQASSDALAPPMRIFGR